MLLVKNVSVYSPEPLGIKDVLICGSQIQMVQENIQIPEDWECRVIDGKNRILIPGIIDCHVHITGGGGESSFHTRAPEVTLSSLIKSGITTVVGLLGTDGITRNTENLLAKAKALKEEGISAYICTGHYGYPSVTLTGSIQKDIVFVEEILGLKLAISDHRAPNISTQELIRLASDTRVAEMLSNKAGCMVLHMGDDSRGLEPVFEALAQTSIPITLFRPTHVNRNPGLLKQGMEFLKMGGAVDYTCGLEGQPNPGTCIRMAKELGLPTHRITFSSDGQGSWSKYDETGKLTKIGISSVSSIHQEFKRMVLEDDYPIEEAISYITSNTAKGLQLYPQKGCVAVGADADLVLLDKDMNVDTVIAGGEVMMKEKELLKTGTYE